MRVQPFTSHTFVCACEKHMGVHRAWGQTLQLPSQLHSFTPKGGVPQGSTMPRGIAFMMRAAEAASLRWAFPGTAQSLGGQFVICYINKKHYKLTSTPAAGSGGCLCEAWSWPAFLFIYFFFNMMMLHRCALVLCPAYLWSPMDKISACANPPNLWCPICLSCHSVLQAVNGFAYS